MSAHTLRLSVLLARLAAIALALVLAPGAHAAGLNWSISSFDVEVNVRTDGSLEVTETIVADFSREPRHGIYRTMPYAYRRHGTAYKIRLDIKEITDASGAHWWHDASRDNGRLTLKIGDPNRQFRAPTTYRIRYTVNRALLRFDDHDELYWNATGDQWPVPIDHATCTIRFPPEVDRDSLRATSYVGALGSATPGPEATILPDGSIRFAATGGFAPHVGMTIVVGWAPGVIETPTASTRLTWFLADNSIIVVPFGVFLVLWTVWRLFGRDKGSPGSVMVRYEAPDGLTPVEVGAIIDERVDRRDITATIVDLAIRGYLRIDVRAKSVRTKPKPGTVWLVRTSRDDTDLKPFERELLTQLFADASSGEISLEDLQFKFYKAFATVRTMVYKQLADAGYFDGHLGVRRAGWIALGIGAGIATILITGVLVQVDVFAPLTTIIACVLTAPQFVIFARIMPRKTAKGRRAFEGVKGLEEYILRAEREELEAGAARDRFEGLLGHAMALGMADQLAERFKNLYDAPPDWYTCPPGSTFNTVRLVRHIGRSEAIMGSALAAAPRSSGGGGSWSSGGAGGGSSGFGGGGFSGGGFGGGGGGSW